MRKPISLRYHANTGTMVLKNAFYNGMRIRESDSALVMALTHPEDHKSLTIDIGQIDTLWVNGKVRKLKSPGSQHKFREAEIKHLLEGRKLEEWTTPYLSDYNLEGAVPIKHAGKGLVGGIVSASGLLLISLPALACVGFGGFIIYVAVKLFVNAH